MINKSGIRNVSVDSFVNRVDVELQRAERYRFFVSLIALDISFVDSLFGDSGNKVVDYVVETIQANIRVIDDVSLMGNKRLVLLMPETSRQGAEMAAKRLKELIRVRLATQAEREVGEVIPLEMASYPDAAGAKKVKDFVQELAKQSSN